MHTHQENSAPSLTLARVKSGMHDLHIIISSSSSTSSRSSSSSLWGASTGRNFSYYSLPPDTYPDWRMESGIHAEAVDITLVAHPVVIAMTTLFV